jgi:hypothetical protein
MKLFLQNAVPLNQCASPWLRAKRRFLGFARKIQSPVTGKTLIIEICP